MIKLNKKMGLVIGLIALVGLVEGVSVPELNVDSMTFPFAENYIYISSNEDFKDYEIVGSGTVDDPYLIENLNLEDHVGNGIVIENVDVHLMVRNCTIKDLSGRYDPEYMGFQGIIIENAKNVRIEGCEVPSIILDGVEKGYIENCTTTNGEILVTNNPPQSGVYLISGCKANGGLAVMNAANSLVENCRVENGEFAVMSSINATLRNVTAYNCTFFPLDSSKAEFEKINLIKTDLLILDFNLDEFQVHLKNSTVDGRDVLYYRDEGNLKLQNLEAGYLWLLNCTGAEIKDVKASGIFLAGSSGSTIENSEIYEGGQGIILSFSKDCIVYGNDLSNSKEGITVGRFDSFSSNNTLRHNLISASGLSTDSNQLAGIRAFTEYNLIVDNVISDSDMGILIAGTGNTITGNTVANNDVGIRVEEEDNDITNNNFIYNGKNAVQGISEFASETPNFANNHWDGNFWASAFRPSFEEPDENGDGQGDVPYQVSYFIADSPVDNAPLTRPVQAD